MSNEGYLRALLIQQNLNPGEVARLHSLREEIEGQLSVFPDRPRFYYAGSYGKKTIIRERYDLDIVVYWPDTTTSTLAAIYQAVGRVLGQHWRTVEPHNVSWKLPFDGNFHVDVVPGRALDASYYEANLYRGDTGTSLKTSIKKHIDTVRGSGRVDAIRLMKLWRERKKVPFKKSFLLEMLTIEACSGMSTDEVVPQVVRNLQYIRDNILRCNIVDPANSNNSLCDDLTYDDKERIRGAAQRALSEPLDYAFGLIGLRAKPLQI